jgi:anaerobic selenocysteine-containing dehydrogenase/Fe-S-cluster-containing dehydrogenase component
MSVMDRRSFFKIVATTGAAAAAGGCGPSAEQFLPYVVPPDNIVPGIPAYFSTVCRECPSGCGLIAKNRDGRVIKLEGNPDHPVNTGGLCIRGHAGLQGLYHPDRFRGPLAAGKPIAWDAAEKQLVEKLGALAKAKQGARIAVVSGLETGSLGRLMDEWVRALGARPRITYEPLGYEALRAANRVSFGRDAIPDYAIGEASYLLSFGADFLETWLSPVAYTADFARMHAFLEGRSGTFVHVEPRLSLTAANADQWIRNAPGTEVQLALAVLRVIVDEGLQAPGADVATLRVATRAANVEAASSASGVSVETIKRLAREFAGSKGGLAIGGGMATNGSNATEVLVAVNLLNAAVGALGTRVRFGGALALGKGSPYSDMLSLTRAMGSGQIDVLLLVDVNPVYAMPPKSGFVDALAKVPLVVAVAARPSETTTRAHLVLPSLHALESWGDYIAQDGVVGLMQPTMGPVQIDGKSVDGRSTGDIFLAVGRQALGLEAGKGPLRWDTFEGFLKEEWQKIAKEHGAGGSFTDFWEGAQRRGGVWRSAPPVAVALRPEAGRIPGSVPTFEGEGSHVLIVYPSTRFYDGRSSDRAWLQEAPDPVTQVTWDGWVEIPTETARSLGVARGDLVKLTSPHGSVELPAYPTDLIHPGAVAVGMGQGRDLPGPYASGQRAPGATNPHPSSFLNVGANPVRLLGGAPESNSGGLPHLAVKVSLAKTGERRALAVPQATFDQDERELAQYVGLAAVRELDLRGKPPADASRPSMYPPAKYPEYKWGMTVDVDRCTGCSACVLACQSENNVPVVGREQAAYGRIQQWLRVERWQEGTAGKPLNMFLPMFCQHCDVAPCEPVCPVYAAYHTREGLNGQVYNRCVGTRYCGNACPYHVRRFNWFNYTWTAPLDQQLNPDVTVREAGVMEKCTMCLQRIVAAKAQARDEGRPVKDGDMQTACQQTCPTRAITFGNLKDSGARVAKLSLSTRGYHVLADIGTAPAVTYLKKVVRAEPDQKAGAEHKA